MSFMYDAGRNEFAKAGVNWLTDTIRVYLVDSQEYNTVLATAQSTHTRLSDIPVGGRVASADLMNKALPGNLGVLDADDITFVNVPVGDNVSEYVVLVKIIAGGTDVDHRLLMLIDSATATGLPVTPNGGDLVVRWSDGANRIARI